VHEARPSFNALKIEAISLSVRLGCTLEERSKPQEVRASVELRFRNAPKGMITDALSDTICYAKVVRGDPDTLRIPRVSIGRGIAYEVYGLIRDVTGPDIEIGVAIIRCARRFKAFMEVRFFAVAISRYEVLCWPRLQPG